MQGQLSANKVPQIVFIWDYSNLSFIFEGQFLPDVEFLVDSCLFSLSTLYMSIHFLNFKVPAEKTAEKLIEDPLYARSCFHLITFHFVM
jgi:hypothetical protein